MYYGFRFLSWCKNYEEEVKELIRLIENNPSDIKQLKKEYLELTGKRYRRKTNGTNRNKI